jgi:hypothetical protein
MAKKLDSLAHNEERRTKIKGEAAAVEAPQEHTREKTAREHDIEFLEQQVSLVKQTDTRDVLLERIRRMREEKPPVYEPPPLSPAMQAQLEREQAAGRAAVANNEAMEEANREISRKQQEEERLRNRVPELIPLIYPNPSQDEQYPASGATLGKTK